MFSQNLLSSIWLTIDDLIFNTNLLGLIQRLAPELDAEAVVFAGATGIRDILDPGLELISVLTAYAMAVGYTFYISAASITLTIFFVWGLGWRDVRKKEPRYPASDISSLHSFNSVSRYRLSAVISRSPTPLLDSLAPYMV